MATEKTVTVRGEGGVEWTLSLPLSEPLQEQVVKGALQPVDEESTALLEELFNDGEEWFDPDGESTEEVEVSVSAAAAKLAEALGVDLTTVIGTGKGGSITKGDVEDAAPDEDPDGESTEE